MGVFVKDDIMQSFLSCPPRGAFLQILFCVREQVHRLATIDTYARTEGPKLSVMRFARNPHTVPPACNVYGADCDPALEAVGRLVLTNGALSIAAISKNIDVSLTIFAE